MSGYQPRGPEKQDRVTVSVTLWAGHVRAYQRSGILPNAAVSALARAIEKHEPGEQRELDLGDLER